MTKYPTIADIGAALETWALPAWAESYDNVGLQVGDPVRPVSCALLALDCTPAVIREARQLAATLIITHHPLLFRPLRTVSPQLFTGNLALRMAEARIALYSIHTNLDAAPDGVSLGLASLLGLSHIRTLKPREDAPHAGMGAIGRLEEAVTLQHFLQTTANCLRTPTLRYAGNPDSTVETVVVCGGSGSFLVQEALTAGADAYVTADITYHTFFDVLDLAGEPRMALIDAGHYETEAHTEVLLQKWLAQRFPEVQWIRTITRTSPVRTFISPGI